MSTAPLPEAPIFDETGAAKERLLSRRGEPLLYANWDNVLFIHYEIESRTNCSTVFPTLWIFTMAAHLSVSWLSPCAECDRGLVEHWVRFCSNQSRPIIS